MLYGWPFHKQTLNFLRRFRFSRLRIFRFFKFVIFDDLIYEAYTVVLLGFSVATPDPWNKANDGS